MKRLSFVLFLSISYYQALHSQSISVSKKSFFSGDSVIEVTFSTDIKQLMHSQKGIKWQPANIAMQFPGSPVINEQITVRPRGIYRRENCNIASLMLNFKNAAAPKLSPLKELKLVGGCRSGKADEELLLKEYLIYKIYNFISPMSFKVRLLHINYRDSREKVKPYTQYAFVMENIKDLASRNNCIEKENVVYGLDDADRQQFNNVCIFQYMIGNTDWSMRQYHNIKLMVPKKDTLARPYVIPYDFDYAGLVNASYAVPNEDLGITSVTERLYRGFARTMEELEANLKVYKEKKDAIMEYINNFPFLDMRIKKDMIRYLDQFYKVIEDKNSVRNAFINNARTY